jgi:leucyl aminopeptidase
MNVTATKKKPSALKADLYVVPVAEKAETGGAVRELAASMRKDIETRVKKNGFHGKAGKTLAVQADGGDVLLVGVGKDPVAENYRVAASKGRAAASSVKAKHVVICAGSGAQAKKHLPALVEGALLGGYRFDKYRSKKPSDYKGPTKLTIAGSGIPDGAATKAEIQRSRAICDGVALSRDLVNEISGVKTPSYLVKTARAVTRGTGIRCDVWQGQRLVKEKMNGILAVSAGSKEPGAFIRMVYKPKRRPRAKIAVVGKGITFDSGGLSLKPAKSMEWMKQDMAGAAAVLGLMKAVAALQPAVEVRGYIASAENMPGQGAQKPGDVITYRNGTTAEVLNTDAEGRLVLADALCVATEDEPDCIIDLATLTGACMVALGTKIAGVMGSDQPLIDDIISHGKEAGEPFWQLPLAEEFYMDDIRSWNADIKNIGGGWAGTITAALFLKCFVKDTPWAHLDIAGPAFAEGVRPYSPRGGTGFGVRTLVSYIDSI